MPTASMLASRDGPSLPGWNITSGRSPAAVCASSGGRLRLPSFQPFSLLAYSLWGWRDRATAFNYMIKRGNFLLIARDVPDKYPRTPPRLPAQLPKMCRPMLCSLSRIVLSSFGVSPSIIAANSPTCRMLAVSPKNERAFQTAS